MLKTYTNEEVRRIKRILLSIPALQNKQTNYWTAVDEVYANEEISQILETSNIDSHSLKLSAGTSVLNTPTQLLASIVTALQNHTYRFYMPSAGSPVARDAIALRESYIAGLRSKLDQNDIVMTTGSTGAISSIFEMVAAEYPQGTVLIAGPTYYLYRFCAQYYKLKYIEVSNVTQVDPKRSSWLCLNEIITSINDGIKLVCIVNPTNPTGEYYSKEQLNEIFTKAKLAGAIVLVDELFGFLDYSSGMPQVSALSVAEKSRTSNNVIIVNGFSKTNNLAGFRIGYLATKNISMIRKLTRINQVRSCFPVGDFIDNMLVLDSQFRISKYAQKKGIPRLRILKLINNQFNNRVPRDFWKQSDDFWKTMENTTEYYESELLRAKEILGELIETSAETKVGFNSLVKIKGLDSVNMFDFSVNCYLATGVKVELGPSYGLGQKVWEANSKYGFWIRLTTARDKRLYTKALLLFKKFIHLYLQKKRFDVTTNLNFI
ncbi:MAG: pyridoxal phosphate-dependent aminotransferase [Candidatus Roizmanbacteria bacterium]